jgi:hypothetical protein
MPELFIFRAGKYPQGDWPEDRVKKLVDAYDPETKIEAPAVIGHRAFAMRDSDQYAHGWVESLRMDKEGKVYATIPEFSLEARRAIAEKKLRYISVEIYELDKENKEEPPYLRAIALLGRDTPAVMGTKIPAMFSLATGGVVNTVDEESHISTFTRKVSAGEFKTLSSGGQETKEDKTMGDKGEGSRGTEELQSAELRTKLEESEKKIAAFRKENEDLKNAGRKQEAEAVFSKLRDEGKLPPALFDRAVALDARLGEEDRKELRAIVSAMEAKVDLSGHHKADQKTAPPAPGTDLTAKIRAYQKEKKFASFSDAATAMFAENPALFEEEGNHD